MWESIKLESRFLSRKKKSREECGVGAVSLLLEMWALQTQQEWGKGREQVSLHGDLQRDEFEMMEGV